MQEWLLKWFEREWLIMLLVLYLIDRWAMAGVMSVELIAVIVPVTTYIFRRTKSKN